MTNEIGIYNHETGESLIREMTKDEKKIIDSEVAAFHEQEAAKVQERLKAIADKAALLAKLGMSEDDLKTLLS
jgi:hypothetical protein